MGILDKLIERRVRAVLDEQATTKAAGFMSLDVAADPTGAHEQTYIADYTTFVRAYKRLPWLYAGVTALAVASTKPWLRLYREVDNRDDVEQEEIVGEPINELLERPNESLSYNELIQVTVINLALVGNAYWNLVGTRPNQPISETNPPVEIWWVKPGQMRPVPKADGTLSHYLFTSADNVEKTLDPSEVIHFRLPNPDSYHIGLGMMEPLMTTSTLEFNAQSFQRGFMENNGTPPFVFRHPGSPTKEERTQFWRAWDERHKGPERSGRAGMIWGGMEVETLGQSMRDAEYVDLRKMNREEMLGALGVPPSVVGLLEYANYSNMEVQQQKFWEDTVLPMLAAISDKLTLRLGPYFDERIWFEFDYSDVKVLQEDEEQKATIATQLIASGLKTPNQVRAEMYNDDPYEGGDVYYMPMGMLPVGTDSQAAASREQKRKLLAAKSEGGGAGGGGEPRASFWRNPERKKALWQAFEKRVSAGERAMVPAVDKFLREQAKAVEAEARKSPSVAAMRAADLFDIDEAVDEYLGRFESRYRAAFERAGNAGYQATKGMIWIPPEERRLKDNDEFRVSPEQLAALRRQIEQAAQFFNTHTFEVVAELLEASYGEDALTVNEVAARLRAKLEELSPARSRTIARTEMARTENWGGVEGYKQNEYVDMKGWMCSFVPDSRDAHEHADGDEVGINEEFKVGTEMLAYPGDPKGAPGNTINCLCSTYPVVSLEV